MLSYAPVDYTSVKYVFFLFATAEPPDAVFHLLQVERLAVSQGIHDTSKLLGYKADSILAIKQ